MKKDFKNIEFKITIVQCDILLASGDYVASDIYDDFYDDGWTDFQ